MRAAPPVEVALGGGGPERMVTILLHALAGGVLAAWLGAQADWQPIHIWAAAIGCAGAGFVMLGALMVRRLLPVSAGRLRWNGAQWTLMAAAGEQPLQRVIVALDLGGWMLLRLHPEGVAAAQWRVASARTAPAAWHGLRLALSTHAGAADTTPSGEGAR